MSVAGLMTGTIDVQQQASNQDASGGATRSWGILASGVPCDIQAASSTVRRQYERRNLIVTHTIFVTSDISVRANMRAVTATQTFIVQGYRPGPSFRGSFSPAYYELDVEEQPNPSNTGEVSVPGVSLSDEAGIVLTDESGAWLQEG